MFRDLRATTEAREPHILNNPACGVLSNHFLRDKHRQRTSPCSEHGMCGHLPIPQERQDLCITCTSLQPAADLPQETLERELRTRSNLAMQSFSILLCGVLKTTDSDFTTTASHLRKEKLGIGPEWKLIGG